MSVRDRLSESYQALSAGSVRQAQISARTSLWRVIAPLGPAVNIGVVAYGAAGYLIAGQRHALRHGAAHAAQGFGRAAGYRGRAPGAQRIDAREDIVDRDQSAAAAA